MRTPWISAATLLLAFGLIALAPCSEVDPVGVEAALHWVSREGWRIR